jgi:hypothetical protein
MANKDTLVAFAKDRDAIVETTNKATSITFGGYNYSTDEVGSAWYERISGRRFREVTEEYVLKALRTIAAKQ